MTKEIRADARETQYAYETTTSRPKSVTDAKSQVTTYSYFNDDQIKDVSYATPNSQRPM